MDGIVYELYSNPSYRLPNDKLSPFAKKRLEQFEETVPGVRYFSTLEAADPATPVVSGEQVNGQVLLLTHIRDQFLKLMADQLVCSLITSPVGNAQEVLI